MKLGLTGRLFPLMFRKVVYGYTAEAVPGLDIRVFEKKHKKADPEHITIETFDGMIDALCKSDMMKRFYQGRLLIKKKG